MNVRFRLWVDGRLTLDDTKDVTADELRGLARQHADMVDPHGAWLMEVELLDHPDDPDRFIRFGTDARGMADPHPIADPLDHPWARS